MDWKPTLTGNSAPNYQSTLQNNAQSQGVVGKASDALTGQKSFYPVDAMGNILKVPQRVPQRKTNKTMSGEELLGKAMKKLVKERFR